MKNRKLLVFMFVLLGLMFWVGYNSRKVATTVRLGRRTFAATAARLERGRYIVEGPAH